MKVTDTWAKRNEPGLKVAAGRGRGKPNVVRCVGNAHDLVLMGYMGSNKQKPGPKGGLHKCLRCGLYVKKSSLQGQVRRIAAGGVQ